MTGRSEQYGMRRKGTSLVYLMLIMVLLWGSLLIALVPVVERASANKRCREAGRIVLKLEKAPSQYEGWRVVLVGKIKWGFLNESGEELAVPILDTCGYTIPLHVKKGLVPVGDSDYYRVEGRVIVTGTTPMIEVEKVNEATKWEAVLEP